MTPPPRSVDVAVIGRGMIGSAAARHLAEGGQTVALVGSGEPADYAMSDAVFASHYDEFRITRISAADPVWADLATRSIERYADIESRSGVHFYETTGLVTASSDATKAIQIAVDRGADARSTDRSEVLETTTINLPRSTAMGLLIEQSPAGVIRPRALVEAQSRLAAVAGAHLVEHAASAVRRTASGIEIHAGGEVLTTRTVVLATGAYGAELVGVNLAIERPLRTVLHLELERPDDIPCLIVEEPDHPDLDRLYWTAPRRYADGRVRLKVGASVLPLQTAATAADIASWFVHGGSAAEAASLLGAVRGLLPNARILDSHHTPCVMTTTATEYPFIGAIDDGIIVALGGNGSGAKSSDEMGRLAAVVARGEHDGLLDHCVPVT